MARLMTLETHGPSAMAVALVQNLSGHMVPDLKACLAGGATRAPLLAVGAYTEILGGVLRGQVGVLGQGARNFRAFLPFLGEHYVSLDKQLTELANSPGKGLYGVFRSGFVHRPFPVFDSLSIDHGQAGDCGITLKQEQGTPVLFFSAVGLVDDFQKAHERLIETLRNDSAVAAQVMSCQENILGFDFAASQPKVSPKTARQPPLGTT